MDLSILIPARNEQFLSRTVEDILINIRGETEIIVVLDGKLADPGIAQHPRVTVIYHNKPVGQRAATNQAARIARGKYVMKVDAHCAFDEGFDVKMISKMQDDWTMAPAMKNLHAFDWVCPDGHRRYQGPSGPCKDCGKPTTQDVVWFPKPSPFNTAYRFDPTPKFQYFPEFRKRPEGRGEITETMSLQGSCFMMTKERYFALNICDEETFGSWGSQGIEVACKTWLSGGRVVVHQGTWYAHLFRTQGGDFGFPYDNPHQNAVTARTRARDLFFGNKWPLQKHPISWLVKRFWPVPGWTDADLAALEPPSDNPKIQLLYYTDNRLDPEIMEACQMQLVECLISSNLNCKGITAVSLQPVGFTKANIVLPLERGPLTMAKQILAGLEASDADIVFMCEHDVLYHPSHFDFIPPRRDAYYYNVNVWKIRHEDGHALRVDDCKQLSGLVAYRETLLTYFRERVRRIEAEGFTRGNGFEPGTRSVRRGGYDDLPAFSFSSEFPNLDIRHDRNATKNRWSKDQFRNQRYTEGWTEAHVSEIAGWQNITDIIGRYGDPNAGGHGRLGNGSVRMVS